MTLNNEPLKSADIPHDSPDALVALRAFDGVLATKRIKADGKVDDYGNATWFEAIVLDVSTPALMLAAFLDLAKRPDTFVVLGAIHPWVDRKHMLRRKIEHPGVERLNPFTGETDTDVVRPTLYDTPRSYIILDLDEIEAPPDLDRHNLRDCAEYARAQVGRAFHGVGMICIATAGYLRKPGLRFRMVVRSSRPLTPGEMKRWFQLLTKEAGRRKPVVDLKVFDSIQANYTAAPIFDDPKMDPLPGGRIVVLEGKPMVDPPPPEALRVEIAPPKPRSARARKPGPPHLRLVKGERENVAPRITPIDSDYAGLIDDDEAIAAATAYLEAASTDVSDGRHPAACKHFMRLLDLGCSPDRAVDLLFEHWSPDGRPYDDRADMAREVGGLEHARENMIGCRHPRVIRDAVPFILPDDEWPEVEVGFVTLEEAKLEVRRVVDTVMNEIFKRPGS